MSSLTETKFLITVCPHCKKLYRLPYKYDDKFIECPNCQQSFWVERYLIPVEVNGMITTDYKRHISDILDNLCIDKISVKIKNYEGCLSLSVKNNKYLISFNDTLFSAEEYIPDWKLKKMLTYFCTGERDWQNLIKWSTSKDLWIKWEKEAAEKEAVEKEAIRQKQNQRLATSQTDDKVVTGCLTIIVLIFVIFCISSCIDEIKNPPSYPYQSTSNYNQNNNVKHPYMTEWGKKFFEGWLETAVKEETGLDSKATMKYDESSGKIYFDLEYK